MPIMGLRRLGPRNVIKDYHIDQFVDALEGLADAYDVAVADGFVGTRAQWLASLKGPQGEPGTVPIGSVATASDLSAIVDPTVDDVWTADDTGHAHRWTGSAWVDIGQWRGPQGPGGADTALRARVDPGVPPQPYDEWRAGPDGDPVFSPSGVIKATDFGAVADGVTDNATAFTALASAVNAIPNTTGAPVTVEFPADVTSGDYRYSGGLVFTRPVMLTGRGRLNHTGTGYAVTFGPDTLDDTNYFLHKRYGAADLTFTGGENQAHGLYFADHVVEPRLYRVAFETFGNIAGFAVYFQADNWDILMDACDWYTTSASHVGRNWVRVNGVHATSTGHASRVAGETDGGNSHFRASNCQATNLNTGGGAGSGVGFWIDGYNPVISGCVLSGFEPNLRLGLLSRFSWIDKSYFEIVRTNGAEACIEYGDPTGTGVLIGPKITKCHFNVHNTDAIGVSAYPIAYASAGMGLQGAYIADCDVAAMTAGREMVKQANISGQTGNSAARNAGVGVLHTSGGSITRWAGEMGESPRFGGHANASTYLQVQGGWSADQYAGLQIMRSNGTVAVTIARSPATNAIEITNVADGKTWLLDATGALTVPGGFGANGASPKTKRTLGTAATDPATTQALANALRQALIDLGLGQT